MLERGPAVPAAWGCGCPLAVQVWEVLGCSFLTADALKDHGDRAVLAVLAAAPFSRACGTVCSDSESGSEPASSYSSRIVPGHHTMALFLVVTAGQLFLHAVRAAPCVEEHSGLCVQFVCL